MFGCIQIPDFPVQTALLREPKALPLGLLDGPESLLKVVACNAPARNAGVGIGMTKLQAEVCGVTLRRRIQEQEETAQSLDQRLIGEARVRHLFLGCDHEFGLVLQFVGKFTHAHGTGIERDDLELFLAMCGFKSLL